jgi:hypothetical protein
VLQSADGAAAKIRMDELHEVGIIFMADGLKRSGQFNERIWGFDERWWKRW